MNIVVAGGTGFIGRPLVRRFLDDGHAVVVLTRPHGPMPATDPRVTVEAWDGKNPGTWEKHVGAADAVVNLAGEPIAGRRWTRGQKSKILDSRVNATTALVDAMRRSSRKPALLINGSGIGYYGDVPSGAVSEASPNGKDFLADVCHRWEGAASAAESVGVRVVATRFGVVLGDDGGALPRLTLPFKLMGGGYLGTGRQWFPWVHREDVFGAFAFVLKHPDIKGAVNLVAPEAATMKSFCATVGKVMHRPSWTFVPSFVLRTALGEMSDMLLTGQQAIPKKLVDAGYTFRYPTLEPALASILS